MLTEEVGDAVAGDTVEPGGDLFYRLHEPVGLDELVEDVLEDVLGVAGIEDSVADEGAEAGFVARQGVCDELVLLGDRPFGGGHWFLDNEPVMTLRVRAMLVLTGEAEEYCINAGEESGGGMRRWVVLAGVMGWVLASGVVCAQDDSTVKDGRTKLQFCSGLPCVEVMVDKRKLLLGIDIANPHSVLEIDVVTNEGLDVTPYVGRDGKTVPGWSMSEVPSVKAGTIEFKYLKVVAGHLLTAKAADQMPEVDGTLGYEAFKGKVLRMDLRKMTVEVASAGGGCDGSAMKLIPFGKSGAPVVTATGFSVNGKPVVAKVDTFYAGTMLVYPDAVEKVGLTAEANKTRNKVQEHFPYTDGGVDMLKATASEEFAGKALGADLPVYLALPGVRLPDGSFDAMVGMKLLNGHTVTFDFAQSCFGLQ